MNPNSNYGTRDEPRNRYSGIYDRQIITLLSKNKAIHKIEKMSPRLIAALNESYESLSHSLRKKKGEQMEYENVCYELVRTFIKMVEQHNRSYWL